MKESSQKLPRKRKNRETKEDSDGNSLSVTPLVQPGLEGARKKRTREDEEGGDYSKNVGVPKEKQEGDETRTGLESVHSKTPFFTFGQRYELSLSVRSTESAVAVDQPRRSP